MIVKPTIRPCQLVPLTFKSLVVILPVEEMESVLVQIRLSGEEGIFASETDTVEEAHVESRQCNEREVNREFNIRQFSRLIGYSSLEQALVIFIPRRDMVSPSW